VGSHHDIETPHGPARVSLVAPDREVVGALVLGHGAGGGFAAKDLIVATRAATGCGLLVAQVEQPYRVAGRRSPAPAKQLDVAWLTVIEALRAGELGRLPLIAGGRSSGARVACRTAGDAGAVAVLCLAFPVHPPGRPEKSRLEELDGVHVPTLVVQGESDPFGMPPPGPRRRVVALKGNHSLSTDLPGLEAAVRDWLSRLR
jgi:uncharacterized protein